MRTGELTEDRLARVRALLLDAFGGEFSDDDWAHALGGWHVLAGEEAHAAVVERTIEVGGRALRAGYVEGVATAPALQGRGLGSSVMRCVGELLERRFDLGVLSTAATASTSGWAGSAGRVPATSATVTESSARPTRTPGSWSSAAAPRPGSTSRSPSPARAAPAMTGDAQVPRRPSPRRRRGTGSRP